MPEHRRLPQRRSKTTLDVSRMTAVGPEMFVEPEVIAKLILSEVKAKGFTIMGLPGLSRERFEEVIAALVRLGGGTL